MKKLTAFLLAALLLLSLTACAENNSNPTKGTEANNKPETTQATEAPKKDVTPAEAEAAIAKALGEGYLCTVDIPEEELPLSNMADLDLSKINAYVGKQAAVTAVNMDTVIVLDCKDGYAEEAVKTLNENFGRTVSYIRQYPFGVAKVEGARLYRVDNLVLFILAGAAYSGEDPEAEAKLAADEYQKIDDAVKALFGSLPENLISVPAR